MRTLSRTRVHTYARMHTPTPDRAAWVPGHRVEHGHSMGHGAQDSAACKPPLALSHNTHACRVGPDGICTNAVLPVCGTTCRASPARSGSLLAAAFLALKFTECAFVSADSIVGVTYYADAAPQRFGTFCRAFIAMFGITIGRREIKRAGRRGGVQGEPESMRA